MKEKDTPELDELVVEEHAASGKEKPKAKAYVVRIDETQTKVNNPNPTGTELLALVNLRPCSHVLVQTIRNADDQFIDPDEHVDLRAPGVERFATVAKDIVVIWLNTEPKDIARGNHSVQEILGLLGFSVDSYDLLQEKDGPPLPLSKDNPVIITGCEVFYAQVSSGGSS